MTVPKWISAGLLYSHKTIEKDYPSLFVDNLNWVLRRLFLSLRFMKKFV
jgi:hypothetical protein